MCDQELEVLLDKLKIIKKAYDNIRLVDPLKKSIIDFHDNELNETGLQCYAFWGKNKICDNCISVRSFHDNHTYIKMEYTADEIYMVTAIPIELSDRRVVIELMKNATDSLVLDTNDTTKHSEIYAIIDNMNNLSLKDPLTGIYNRRYINEKLPVLLVNSAIKDSELSIIMADIDYFKKVNDTYGHLGGDNTLINFASLLSNIMNEDNGWAARYGGEEFLICLPDTSLSDAVKIAEKIRKAVEDNTVRYGEHQIKITSSFGISSTLSEGYTEIEKLIEAADKKLYEAKQNGRNRVEA